MEQLNLPTSDNFPAYTLSEVLDSLKRKENNLMPIQLDYWYWLILAVVLLILEIALPGVFFLWLAISAACIGMILWLFPNLYLTWQIFLFAVIAITSVIGWRFYQKKFPEHTDEPLLNRRGQQYIGRVFTVTDPIVNGYGRAKVGDSQWKVAGPDCPSGTKVKVLWVDNNMCLNVEPIADESKL